MMINLNSIKFNKKRQAGLNGMIGMIGLME